MHAMQPLGGSQTVFKGGLGVKGTDDVILSHTSLEEDHAQFIKYL